MGWLMVSVNACVALEPTPLLAVIIRLYVPAVPSAGVPLSRPLTKVTPLGRAPLAPMVGAGKPVTFTVKEPAAPTVNAVLLALVIAGGTFLPTAHSVALLMA